MRPVTATILKKPVASFMSFTNHGSIWPQKNGSKIELEAIFTYSFIVTEFSLFPGEKKKEQAEGESMTTKT